MNDEEVNKEVAKRAELASDIMQYLNNTKPLLDTEDFDRILEAELKAMSNLCEVCGGAMCGEYCPVFRYTFDINKYIGDNRDKKCETGQS